MKKVLAISVLATAIALASSGQSIAAPSFDEPETWSLLAAGEREALLTVTTMNVTTNNNGTNWYYGPGEGYSMGFVKEGFCIDQDTADGADDWIFCDGAAFNQESAQTRLSWHLSDTQIVDGWRVGTVVDLSDELTTSRRAIYTAQTEPAYYPYGPMTGVDVADLDGWTLCWIDDYAQTTSLDTIWSVCDGDYLLFAGYHENFEWVGDVPNGLAPGEAELADTGFNAVIPVAVSGGLFVLAAVAVRRRRS